MNRPNTYEKMYWSVFNFLGKTLGIFAIIGAIIFLLDLLFTGLSQYTTTTGKIVNTISPFVLGALGYLFVKVTPYYPNHFHEYYKSIGVLEEDKLDK